MNKIKNNKKERRVINVSKEDFDIIKEYCNKHAYSLTKRVSKILLREISKEI